ncbi:MAG: hydroxyethylthiazole kinase, partial [Bacillota bacterium]|nr:hydroxyethylthiazole kinase [Bacillota bacterium]
MRQADRRKPLIHCITNYVTAESIANAIIEAGGSPVMADDLCEVEEVTAAADALLLNLGTPNPARIEAMLVAGKTANRLGIPVFLDPVGCGATGFRLEAVKRLLAQIRFHTIRGNASEMMTIHTGERAKTLGVDADPSLEIRADALEPWISVARSIAETHRCRAIITGHCDVEAVPREGAIEVITREHPMREAKKSTGEGCRMTARLAVEAALATLPHLTSGCEITSDSYDVDSRGGNNPYLLYAITERFSDSSDYLGKIESALASGVTMLQFREKELKGERLFSLAREVQTLCRKYRVPFIVNDSVDLAVAVGADGVHLGQKDDSIEDARTRLPGKFVGMTAHS